MAGDAAARADEPFLRALHAAGADMDAPDASRAGRRPLHYACLHPNGLECVKFLVAEAGEGFDYMGYAASRWARCACCRTPRYPP